MAHGSKGFIQSMVGWLHGCYGLGVRQHTVVDGNGEVKLFMVAGNRDGESWVGKRLPQIMYMHVHAYVYMYIIRMCMCRHMYICILYVCVCIYI